MAEDEKKAIESEVRIEPVIATDPAEPKPIFDRATRVFAYFPEARAQLVSVSNPSIEKSITSRPFTIGRTDTCDLVLDQPGVSRVHVTIEFQKDVFVLDSKGSLNGVLVNGALQTGISKLRSGDLIQICEETFRFIDHRAAAARLGAAGVPSRPFSLSETPTLVTDRPRHQLKTYLGTALMGVLALSTYASHPWIVAQVAGPATVVVPQEETSEAPARVLERTITAALPALLKVKTTPVVARIAGQVKQMRVKPAAEITKGDVLIDLGSAKLEQEIEAVRDGLVMAERSGAEASAKRITLQLQALEAKRRTLTVVAPTNGHLRAYRVANGDTVEVGQTVADLVETDDATVEVTVPQDRADQLVAGTRVAIHFGAEVEAAGAISLVRSDNGRKTAVIRVEDPSLEWLELPVAVSIAKGSEAP